MELRDDGENRGSSGGRQTNGIERVEHGVNGRQTEGVEAMEDGVEGMSGKRERGDRWSRKSSGKGEREDGGRRRKASGKGGRDKVGWLRWVMEEDQKKPMEWACARQ